MKQQWRRVVKRKETGDVNKLEMKKRVKDAIDKLKAINALSSGTLHTSSHNRGTAPGPLDVIRTEELANELNFISFEDNLQPVHHQTEEILDFSRRFVPSSSRVEEEKDVLPSDTQLNNEPFIDFSGSSEYSVKIGYSPD